MEFWLAVISMMIAGVGGIPGIISIANFFRNRAIIKIFNLQVAFAEIQLENDKSVPLLVVFFTVLNKGDKPFFINNVSLKFFANGKNYKFKPLHMPDDKFGKGKLQINFEQTIDIISNSNPITSIQPMAAHLKVVSDEISLEDFLNIGNYKIELEISDFYNRKVLEKREFSKDDRFKNTNLQGSAYDPKYGWRDSR